MKNVDRVSEKQVSPTGLWCRWAKSKNPHDGKRVEGLNGGWMMEKTGSEI
jgi:hypothetical protein